jgi:hypothetical protein
VGACWRRPLVRSRAPQDYQSKNTSQSPVGYTPKIMDEFRKARRKTSPSGAKNGGPEKSLSAAVPERRQPNRSSARAWKRNRVETAEIHTRISAATPAVTRVMAE